MTAPDTKAIRAQMEALTGFTAGPWRDEDGVIQSQTVVWQNGVKQVGWDYAAIRAEVTDDWDQAANARLIAAAPDMHATILALCDALDTEQSKVRRMGREVNYAKYGQPDFAWGIHLEAMAELNAENERLHTIIDNLHAVEEKHRETANAEFHRANRLQVENERLREALTKINVGDGWAAQIARAALAQKGED